MSIVLDWTSRLLGNEQGYRVSSQVGGVHIMYRSVKCDVGIVGLWTLACSSSGLARFWMCCVMLVVCAVICVVLCLLCCIVVVFLF